MGAAVAVAGEVDVPPGLASAAGFGVGQRQAKLKLAPPGQLLAAGVGVKQVGRCGEDGPLVGHRVSGDWVDVLHLAGFSRDCLAVRQRTSSLILPGGGLVERARDQLIPATPDWHEVMALTAGRCKDAVLTTRWQEADRCDARSFDIVAIVSHVPLTLSSL
ncbi:MAG: hypothetical protein ACRDRP_19090 [Pseudonocardiaceae bacterium]